MFGLITLFKNAHLVSHMELAAIKYLLEPGNPIMKHVSPVVLPAVNQELAALQVQVEAKIPQNEKASAASIPSS